MIVSYYKTALRQIARNRFHSLLNITGLSVGIAFTLLIAIYGWSEWNVNHDLRNYSRQYIITSDWKDPNLGYPLATLGPLAKALKDDYPSLVANYYRFDGITVIAAAKDRQFREELQMGDSTFLPMYGFTLLHGDARTALDKPFTVVITDDRAIKFFGTTDVVGRDLTIINNGGRRAAFRITGVLQKPALNSVTQLTTDNSIFVSAANLDWFGRTMNWNNDHIAGYIELQPGASLQSIDTALHHLVQTNADPIFAANLTAHAEPLTRYYLDANGATVRRMIYTLSFIAVFILGMAMINFINLSVSRSGARMKEIGVRKVLGSLKSQLRGQFIAESIGLALLATIIALLLYTILCPVFSAMLNREMPSLITLPLPAWALIALFGVLTGWLAGLYPAMLLSSVSTINVLKGKTGTVGGHLRLRKALVGFQFATALIVFIGAIIVSRQIELFFSDRLGYTKDFILTAQLPRDWSPEGVRRMERIRSVFAALPQVREAALSFEIPNGANSGDVSVYREGSDPTRPLNAQSLVSDAHYAATYQIPMAAGAFFQFAIANNAADSRPPDSTRVVLNETAAKALGYATAADAVGQRIRLIDIDRTLTISGVVKDFHFDGMGAAIQPEVFTTVNTWNIYRYLSFQLRPGNIPAAIAALQQQWSALMPGAPFEYRFMDDALRTIYDSELRLRKAAFTATVLAFIIVLLGVVGLVSGSVRRRTREIAIRKVIGAGVPGIIGLFLREYLPVLFVAGLIASPLTAWIMQRWLNDYPTRIIITAWPFVIAIGSMGLTVILLIVGQTLSAAFANPTRSLKAE
jgi:putative ABC transport system permease protein